MSNRTKPTTNASIVKHRRSEMGLTQEELGRLVDLSKAQISLIESGKNNVSQRKMLVMAKTLGITVDDLLMSNSNN